jgi:hypothetical protein
MGIVRASCADCGDIEITSAEVRVRVCVDDNAGSYVLRCPRCSMAVARPASPRVVRLLVEVGSPLTMWRLPDELSEAHVGPPLTHDELLAFHHLLETDGWFSRVASMVRG